MRRWRSAAMNRCARLASVHGMARPAIIALAGAPLSKRVVRPQRSWRQLRLRIVGVPKAQVTEETREFYFEYKP